MRGKGREETGREGGREGIHVLFPYIFHTSARKEMDGVAGYMEG